MNQQSTQHNSATSKLDFPQSESKDEYEALLVEFTGRWAKADSCGNSITTKAEAFLYFVSFLKFKRFQPDFQQWPSC